MEYSNVLFTVSLGLIIVLVVKFVRLMQQRWWWQHALRDFPKHPREIFFLGHGKAFLDGCDGMLSNWDVNFDNNEKAIQAWVTPFTPAVICYHSDTIRAIFNTAEPKDWSYGGLLKDWLGDGLLISSGRKWARNRRLLTPAFHFDILKPYVKVFVDSANKLVMKWKKRCIHGACSVEVMEDISLATLDSLMKCIMGVNDEHIQQTGKNHPYIHATYTLTETFLIQFASILYQSDIIFALSPDGYASRKALKIAHGFSNNVIAERKRLCEDAKHMNRSPLKGKLMPFIDILLQAKDDSGQGLSDREIRDEVDTFMFEGHDTTSSALSWFIYNMANNPDAQERCRQEVDAVMGEYGGVHGDDVNLEWDDLAKFEYLTQCIKESMRLHSPVPAVGRMIQSAIELPDGRVLPKGSSVYCHINSLHRNPNIWTDPRVYNPDRFTPENSSKRSPHAFVPFSAGPRNCIGQHFVMAELKAKSAVLLRHFRFTADTDKPVQRICKTVLRSTTGIHILVSLKG